MGKLNRLIFVALAVLVSLQPVAMAARRVKKTAVAPPIPWMAILFATVMLACVCVVGFRNARRTYLD